MSDDSPNPYSPPATHSADATTGTFDPAAVKKVQAIVDEARLFWVAILMCIFCSGLGAVIIGPWYLVRLMQWHAVAKHQPMLLDPNVSPGSLAQRFQSAKLKLIIGMSFGFFILVVSVLLLMSSLATVKRQAM